MNKNIRKTAGLALLACGVVLLAGCTQPSQTNLTSAEVVGTWGSSQPAELGLTLGQDGSFKAHDGCEVEGRWELSGSEITFAKRVETSVACREVEFTQLASAAVHGKTIHLHDSQGKELGKLTKN